MLELDRMEFHVYETKQIIAAQNRPIVLITSNNEKELPDAFLRRCFFHYIRFPDRDTMVRIVDVHFPDLQRELLTEALHNQDSHKIIPPLHGALLKNEQDVHLFERLVFMSRRK